MLTQEQFFEAVERSPLNWVGRQTVAQYGQYKVYVTSGEWDADTIHVSKGVTYKADGSTQGMPNTKNQLGLSVAQMTEEDWAVLKYINLRNNAANRGLEFDLTITSVKNVLKAKKCYYTGLPISPLHEAGNPLQLTVDRVDANKGYVKGNIVACSLEANSFKNSIEHAFADLPNKQIRSIVNKMFPEER